MAKVLYITANPKSPENSVGLQVGQSFLDAYKEAHPSDEVTEFDLYKETFQTIDGDVIMAMGKMRNQNMSFSELSPIEQQKLHALNEITEMVTNADKYVFVSPMWNWGIPPQLKAFIDAFVVVGKTFYYTEHGPVGYLKDKKAIHIQVSGGIFSEGPFIAMDHSHPYLKMVLGIVGISNVEALYVEGHEFKPENKEAIVRAAMAKASKLAAVW